MERHIESFLNDWRSLRNQDVITYFRDSMKFVSTSNLDNSLVTQLLDYVEKTYQSISLELIDAPLITNNRVAAQWQLSCSSPIHLDEREESTPFSPQSIVLSGADFIRGFQGKVREVDVYFDNKDLLLLQRITSMHQPINGRKIGQTSPSYRKSGLSEDEISTIAQRMTATLSTQKPFLDSEFSLSKLATLVGVKPNHASQVISQHFKTNFFQLMADFRMEEAKRRLSNTLDESVLNIALDAGFGSKSVFYNVFRKHTGMTPLQYRKSLRG